MMKRMPPGVVAAILLLVIVLGSWLAVLRSELAPMLAVAMFMLPGAWGVLGLLKRAGMFPRATAEDGARIRRALAGGGLLVALSLALMIGVTHGWMDDAMSERGMGMALGVVLIVVGNGMPKILKPLSAMRCDPAAEQAMHRFAGWTFVLAGVVYGLAYVVLPLDVAGPVSIVVAGAATVLVMVRLGWVLRTGRRAPPIEN